jgi:pyridoxamine 5'-phosphate oxidase
LTDELIPYPTDPVSLFKEWLTEADKSENINPTAMALATADASGVPSVRMVLLKHVDERGFSFYTNSESRKGIEISQNPRASLCFYWKSLLREVRVDGPVSNVGQKEADDYFATRTRGSQIGAWASKQSRPLEGRFELEKRIAAYSAKFNVGKVPRPKDWQGFCVYPERIEFWQERKFRLHDRIVYSYSGEGWKSQRLYP